MRPLWAFRLRAARVSERVFQESTRSLTVAARQSDLLRDMLKE